MNHKHCEEQMYQRLIKFFTDEAELAANLRSSDDLDTREWATVYQERCERYIKVFEISMDLLRSEDYTAYLENKKTSAFSL